MDGRRIGRRLAAAGLLAAGLLAAGPAAAQRAGTYVVEGTSPDGSAYAGQIYLQPTGIGLWRAVWRLGGTQIEGIGLQAGTTFSIAYVIENRPGIVAYEVRPDGVLTGQWSIAGTGDIGTETLTPE